jgi:branched-chain amino acid transport system substrate-binding protein
VAIIANDAEFAHNAADGARENAKAVGLSIVYDKTYPTGTVDFASILRAAQATNPDIIYVASYPPDTVGMTRAKNEIGLAARMFGGSMVGFQTTSIKTQLGSLMNGIVTFDFWLPVPSMQVPGAMDLLRKYQARAPGEGVDLLGYVMGPIAYAEMQILADAVTATRGFDQGKIAEYIHGHSFKTVDGDLSFGSNGEWTKPRVLTVQFQHIADNDLDQFKGTSKEIILLPTEYKSGDAILPYRSDQN